MAPLKLASGCDRRCSFCAIPSFRGSFVCRRPSDVLAEARWLAGAGRARAVPGQRELHVLRQGPRRPAAARDAAARARRRRRRRAGAGVLPAARRDPARPGRGDRDDARASAPTSTCPSSTPARRVLRRMRRFGDPESFLGLLEQVRALAPDGRRPLQRDRRLPRRDRGRPRRPCATSWSPPGSTSSASSATPTRTAPRPRRTTASSTRTRSGPGSSTSPAWSRSSPPQRAEERIGERGRGARRVASTDGDGRGPRRPPGPRGRRHDTALGPPAGARVGDLVRAVVVATEGVDLVARPIGAGDERRASSAVSNWNLPNVLTALRIVMVPFFGWALLARRRRLDRCGAASPARCSSSR